MALKDEWNRLPTFAKFAIPAGIAGGGYLLWRKRQSAASSSSTASTTGTGTSLQTGIDPSTGVPYAQEEAAYYDQNSTASGESSGYSSYNPWQLYGPGGTGTGTATATAPATSTPATAATTPSTPATAPSVPVFNPYPVGDTVAPGETVVSSAPDSSGQGGWDLTNLGGIYTYGNAPFLGSAYSPSGSFGGATVVASPGGGYQINSASGTKLFSLPSSGSSSTPAAVTPVPALIPGKTINYPM